MISLVSIQLQLISIYVVVLLFLFFKIIFKKQELVDTADKIKKGDISPLVLQRNVFLSREIENLRNTVSTLEHIIIFSFGCVIVFLGMALFEIQVYFPGFIVLIIFQILLLAKVLYTEYKIQKNK